MQGKRKRSERKRNKIQKRSDLILIHLQQGLDSQNDGFSFIEGSILIY